MNDKTIVDKYTDPSAPGSFQAVSGFIKNNTEFKNSRRVRKVLRSLPAITLHKPIEYTFRRSKTLVDGIDHQWQVDLVDMSNVAGSNNKHRYILTCIDVFSKHAWAKPMLNKTAATTKAAMESILKDGRKPRLVYSDDGNEFKGECKSFLKSNGIQIFISRTKVKACVVERFNRTLKEKMYRYFDSPRPIKTNLDKKKYIDVLPKLIDSYNNSYHRSIKCTPNQVNKSNEAQIFFNLYGFNQEDGSSQFEEIKFKKGTYVRYAKDKSIFDKGYTAGWSSKIFIVNKIYANNPILYQIINLNGEAEGTFYAEELQQVELDFDTFVIVGKDANDTLSVKQLNSEDQKIESVNEKEFMTKNRYSLRSKK